MLNANCFAMRNCRLVHQRIGLTGWGGCVCNVVAPKDMACLVFSLQDVVYVQSKQDCWSVAAWRVHCAVVKGSQLSPGTASV